MMDITYNMVYLETQLHNTELITINSSLQERSDFAHTILQP